MGFFGSKPLRNTIEQKVVSNSIPAVHEIEGRKKLEANHPPSNKSKEHSSLLDHSVWNDLLRTHVDTSKSNRIHDVEGVHLVDYEGMGRDPRFWEYLQMLEKASLPSSTSSGEAAELAFWINAYNAICIKLIIEYKPKSSITEITEMNPNKTVVWDLIAGKVAGNEVSLNHIEHVQLRGKWDEPTVHACIVCASASCPNLRAEAFSENPTTLQAQMRDQMVSFLKNETKGLKLTSSCTKVKISRIFLWFEKDFISGSEGVKSFLFKYVEDDAVKAVLAKSSTDLRYFEYDWTLIKVEKDGLSPSE